MTTRTPLPNMAKVKVGNLLDLFFQNIYSVFTFPNPPANVKIQGGYYIVNGCNVCMTATATADATLTLPTPASPISLPIVKNSEYVVIDNFNGTIAMTANDIISIMGAYPV